MARVNTEFQKSRIDEKLYMYAEVRHILVQLSYFLIANNGTLAEFSFLRVKALFGVDFMFYAPRKTVNRRVPFNI